MLRSVREAALVDIGTWLKAQGYAFITITPESHRRVNARAQAATDLRGVFGWTRPFEPRLLPEPILAALQRGDLVDERAGLLVSRVRFSTLGDGLYAHSAYPTTAEDSVFFGPDTYRFCAFLRRVVPSAKRVVDVGCGSGVGGLCLADRVSRIVLADINPGALAMARANAHLAGLSDRVELVLGDLFAPVTGDVDLIVANPPYLLDPAERVYRDGGGKLGTGLGVRIVREGLPRLGKGGRLVLYTGAPVVDGVDQVRAELAPLLAGRSYTYEELDPDVFGEELDVPAYAHCDRIAAIGCVIAA